MCVYLRAKFEVSRIILTSFRQRWKGGWVSGEGRRGVILPQTTPQNEPLKRTSRLELKISLIF